MSGPFHGQDGSRGSHAPGVPLRPSSELRILVSTPMPNDAKQTVDFLTKAGLTAEICPTEAELCERMREGCGAVLVAQEALDGDAGELLAATLSDQPSWSDIPVAIVTSGAGAIADARLQRLAKLRRSGKITLIERPFRPMTLVSALDVALRSRRRQYQVRDLLEERTRMSEKAEQQARIFGTILSSISDFAYILDREARFIFVNKAMLEVLGRPLTEVVGRSFSELPIPPAFAAKLQQQVEQVLHAGQVLRDEAGYPLPDGTFRFYDYILSPVLSSDGKVHVVVGSTRDVTERRNSEEALRQQAEVLREADRRKDEFLAMLAHELRNPLASVHAAATVLKSADDETDLRWATGVIDRQSGQLSRLIDDLLDVSRITSGKVRLRMERMDVARVLERACETVRPLCEERRHELRCDYPRGELWVDADPTRLEQIVLNLLTNAAKYTARGGLIQLHACRQADNVVIAVTDNGVGIAPGRIPEMFELFAQGERTIARSEGGLGIGLTLVKRLTEMHGGRIEAQSEGMDRGSSFRILLPTAEAPAPAEVGGPRSPDQGARAGVRILVVDDNRDTAEGLARILRRDGHEVILAHDGLAALEKAAECSPEVVLLDIGLPGLDGYEVAGRLRGGTICNPSLVVALSGYGQDDDRRRSRAAGFDRHLVKPVDIQELRGLVSRVESETALAPAGT